MLDIASNRFRDNLATHNGLHLSPSSSHLVSSCRAREIDKPIHRRAVATPEDGHDICATRAGRGGRSSTGFSSHVSISALPTGSCSDKDVKEAFAIVLADGCNSKGDLVCVLEGRTDKGL